MGDYTPIQAGDPLSATALDDRFDALESSVNNVSAISLRTFDHYHGTPSLIEPNVAFDVGARAMGHAGHPAGTQGAAATQIPYIHRYSYGDAHDPLYPGPDLSTMASASEVGWRVVGDSVPAYGRTEDTVQGRSDAKLECEFAGLGIRLTRDGESFRPDSVGGILVLFNVEVLYHHGPNSLPTPIGTYDSASSGGATSFSSMKFRTHFAIQVLVRKDNGAEVGWRNLKKSHRVISMASSAHTNDSSVTDVDSLGKGLATSKHRPVRGAMWKDVSIRTLITDGDLDTTGLADPALGYERLVVKGVRAVVSLEISDVSPHSGADLYGSDLGMGVTLKSYNMSTLVLGSEFKE